MAWPSQLRQSALRRGSDLPPTSSMGGRIIGGRWWATRVGWIPRSMGAGRMSRLLKAVSHSVGLDAHAGETREVRVWGACGRWHDRSLLAPSAGKPGAPA
jgi:hypothetical protein